MAEAIADEDELYGGRPDRWERTDDGDDLSDFWREQCRSNRRVKPRYAPRKPVAYWATPGATVRC